MNISKYGIMASLALSLGLLFYSCAPKSKLIEKLEVLSADGKLDCKDLEYFTAYVQQNKEDRGIAIVNRRLFKQLFPFPILAHQVSYIQLLNVICLYYTNPQYT